MTGSADQYASTSTKVTPETAKTIKGAHTNAELQGRLLSFL